MEQRGRDLRLVVVGEVARGEAGVEVLGERDVHQDLGGVDAALGGELAEAAADVARGLARGPGEPRLRQGEDEGQRHRRRVRLRGEARAGLRIGERPARRLGPCHQHAHPARHRREDGVHAAQVEGHVDGPRLHLGLEAGAAGRLQRESFEDALDQAGHRAALEEGRERDRDPVADRELRHLVDARAEEVGVPELGQDLQRTTPLAEHRAEDVELAHRAEAAGHRAELVVDVAEARAHAEGTLVEAGTQAIGEAAQLLGRRRAVAAREAEHVEAEQAVAHERGVVDAEARLDRRAVLAEGLPGPAQARVEGAPGHLLDLAEGGAEELAVLGAQRREGQRAVAGDHGRDAVLEGGRREPVPEQLGVVVGMRIDEARGDHEARRVDLPARRSELAPTHGGDSGPLDGDRAELGRPARSVADETIAQDEIEHGDSFRERRRTLRLSRKAGSASPSAPDTPTGDPPPWRSSSSMPD